MNSNKPATFSDKIRSSMVLKLNMRLVGRLVSAFMSINVLILLMHLGVILWQAEEGARVIVNSVHSDAENPVITDEGRYQVLADQGPGRRGLALPAMITKHLPVQNKDVRRSIVIPKGNETRRLWERLSQATYRLSFVTPGQRGFVITYDLGHDFKRLPVYVVIVLFFQLLIIIKNINKGSRSIRQTLKPLAEMAEKTRQLNEKLYLGGSLTDPQIKTLTGVISDIDASRLDRRISIDESQNELKDLASAINGMLNRIGAAYESQLRFVSDASHELRTPIAVIQGYINLLDRWGKADEKTLQESIEAIKSETESMKDLVEQLLFLARGDNETLKLHKQSFESSDVISEIVTEAQMIYPDYSFGISLDRPALINADKQLFKQAVRILVDNSIKYSPAKEQINIKVKKNDEQVRIIVQDNGVGIEPKELPNIFDRFYRSDESRTRKTGGSGLGLAIAKWIVEQHDGHFEVLSRLNIGTRITIVLPRQIKV